MMFASFQYPKLLVNNYKGLFLHFTEYSFLRKLYMSLSQKDQLSYAVTLFVGT